MVLGSKSSVDRCAEENSHWRPAWLPWIQACRAMAFVCESTHTLIRAWIANRWGKTGRARVETSLPVTRPTGAVPAKYVALHKYLTDRYADAVTLTFGQIEDVLGSELPAMARTQPEWWTTTKAQSGDHVQSEAWALAGRTAQPNLGAQIVLFERRPSIARTRVSDQ